MKVRLILSLVVVGLFGLVFSMPSNAAKTSEDQVTICHIPPGNPANAHTITVGISAVDAHVEQHGDYVGECAVSADACDSCAYSHEDYLSAATSCVSTCGILIK